MLKQLNVKEKIKSSLINTSSCIIMFREKLCIISLTYKCVEKKELFFSANTYAKTEKFSIRVIIIIVVKVNLFLFKIFFFWFTKCRKM